MTNEEEYRLKNDNVTINDIARHAGISISTVSRVINDSAPVSKKTKKKVRKAIDELKYTPNAMARGLVKKNSKTICFMVPDILNLFYVELVKSVEDVASSKGFKMILCITNHDPIKEEQYIIDMIERRINGLLLVATTIKNNKIIQIAKKYLEIVSIQADVEGVDRIDTNDEESTYRIIEYLIKLGHEKIAFLGYRYDIKILNNRLNGYLKALKDYNIEIFDDYICNGSPIGDSGYIITKELLNSKNIPDAIHCFNEYLAVGAFKAIKECGLDIPKDISLTGFDDLTYSKLISPQLTTVSQPIYSMGQIATELLIKNIIEGRKQVNQNVTIPSRLIIRESTAPPKK